MSSHITISRIRRRHQLEEKRLITGALVRNKWNINATARDLEVPPSSLRRLIDTHELTELCEQRVKGPGRPRKEQ